MPAQRKVMTEQKDLESSNYSSSEEDINQSINMSLSPILNSSWGPTEDAIPTIDASLPFIPFAKSDAISYIANWDPNNNHNNYSNTKHKQSKFLDVKDIIHAQWDDPDEDARSYISEYSNDGWNTILRHDYDHTLREKDRKPWQKGPSKKHQKRKLRAANARFNKVSQKISNSTINSHVGKKQKLKNAKWKSQRENLRPNETSINIKDAWIPMTEIWFNNTFKNDSIMDLEKAPKFKKLITAGTIHGVLTKYDGLRYPPQPLQVHRYAAVQSFECKPASTDPYIIELARKKKGNIYTTDNVLSAIMCCQRSKYSFDFIVSKIGNNIFLDERNKGLSGYSVDETSISRPTKYKQPTMDYYTSLAFEAEGINHVFHEQMLYQNNLDHVQNLSRSHPFNTNSKSHKNGKNGKNGKRRKKMAVSSQGFSYNLYDISKNMQVICRCGIDGYDDKHNNVKLCALNQYNHNKSQTHDWRRDLNKKQTAILSEEIRNNNFKCARWGIKAKLSDSKYVKLGFVTREKDYKIDKHQIVGVKTFETRDYLKKFGIKSLRDSWNIFIRFINKIKDIEVDGRFIVIRDPLYQVFRIYKIENESFSQDDIASFAGLKKIVKH